MLSSLHPYRYWEEDGQYFFDSPSGAQYVAYFLELPFAKNLYTFNFDRLHSGIHGVVDVRVCDTICSILAVFFKSTRIPCLSHVTRQTDVRRPACGSLTHGIVDWLRRI